MLGVRCSGNSGPAAALMLGGRCCGYY